MSIRRIVPIQFHLTNKLITPVQDIYFGLFLTAKERFAIDVSKLVLMSEFSVIEADVLALR